MRRSFLQLVLVLLLVGILPFAASLLIVNDLFSQAVSVGLNPEIQSLLTHSAEAYRQFFEAEKTAHELAADRVAGEPDWAGARTEAAIAVILERFQHVHPRLVTLTATTADLTTTIEAAPVRADEITRHETRPLPVGGELTLLFALPQRYLDELEAVGDALDTFRALDVVEDQVSRGMRRTYLIFAGAVAVLSLVIGLLLTRRTTTRIGRVASAAARVGAGDLTARVADPGRDEIGALARAFNRMVSELAQSQERLAYLQRVAAWQEIARRLAHEIKNPLTPILLSMQQLDRKFDDYKDNPERFRPLLTQALEIVEEEVGTLRALVEAFRDFARLPKVSPEPIELGPFVEDLVRTNPQLTQQATIDVHLEPTAAQARAQLDPTMMRRALINCLQNGIEAATAARPGGPPPALAIRVSLANGRGVIAVEDDGPGVDPANLANVFDPYFTTKETGTGLGLAIVKKIVLDHGGDVRLENRSETPGCRVMVELPLSSAAVPEPASGV